jgi:hypothetical protein
VAVYCFLLELSHGICGYILPPHQNGSHCDHLLLPLFPLSVTDLDPYCLLAMIQVTSSPHGAKLCDAAVST